MTAKQVPYAEQKMIEQPSNDTMQNQDAIFIEQQSKLKKKKRICLLVVVLAVLALSALVTVIVYVTTNAEQNHKDADTSENCQYYHPQYPFRGGGACSQSCLNDYYASPPLNIKVTEFPLSFSDEFRMNYETAGNILADTNLEIGAGPQYTIDYHPSDMHMTLDYFCCYSPLEIQTIDGLAQHFEWPPIEVTIDKLICTKNDYTDGVELMLMLDSESQKQLLSIVEQFESEMSKSGLIVNVPRSENIGFHITLAHVDQSVFEVNRYVDEINQKIKWSSNSMIMFNNSRVCPGPPQDGPEPWMHLVTCLG
eukprot:320233_1